MSREYDDNQTLQQKIMRGAIFLKVNFQHYLALGHNRNIRHVSASGDAENKIF